MFSFLWSKPKRKIDIQIEVFLKWRDKRGMSLSNYQDWLFMFADFIGKDDIYDVRPNDVHAFIERVRSERNGEWPVFSAEKALRQFIRFYTARGKIMGNLREYQERCLDNHVESITDIKRNRELVRKRLENQRKWSYRKLGVYYGIHYTTARQIFNRDVHKYANG